jgi:DNA-binding GntR family transcriptional regulator
VSVSEIIGRAAAAEPAERPRTAHEYVLNTLRRAILDGDLVGGSRLVQSEIADALEVSKTPVREALRDLASEGLVQLDAHRGGIVHELSIAELEEIHVLRQAIEPQVLRQAWPHITREIIDRAEELNQRMLATDSPAEWVRLNQEFHGCVFELAPSRRLVGILNGLIAPWAMYVSAALAADPDFQVKAGRGHDEILGAMRAGDLEALIEADAEHLGIARNALASTFGATTGS